MLKCVYMCIYIYIMCVWNIVTYSYIAYTIPTPRPTASSLFKSAILGDWYWKIDENSTYQIQTTQKNTANMCDTFVIHS